jgi:hypothetical protein
MKILHRITEPIRAYAVKRLESPLKTYEKRIINNMGKLYSGIRKGDVVLVEGQSEISRMIKLFTQSSWSHTAFYVGDELVKREGTLKEKLLHRFGDEAYHMVIEAFASKGVIAEPISKYQDYNFRICRPYGISSSDLREVIADVVNNHGKQYDHQNIIDLGLMLLPKFLNPFKARAIKACLGSCNDFQVICSGLIAKAFQRVGYPIVPGLCPPSSTKPEVHANPYGSKLVMRHYSQILPRDFDLSPNFEIIKFNIIESGEFNYKSLWAKSSSVI